ncbi:hypothetical protein SISNIDRAFT_485670 [Sistotremastrum niveocremeum HHB9708]|uniref:Uncharacterized protein n=1 Tax=Sistotremastrum niveocremeum HHB9708 TaxID=1314777 RepID=A0A164UPE1_9AGAM|nr:hypothetical protein SISNIDRAFT_485670 [Sistotremastrum niveocremeum HHB9708]
MSTAHTVTEAQPRPSLTETLAPAPSIGAPSTIAPSHSASVVAEAIAARDEALEATRVEATPPKRKSALRRWFGRSSKPKKTRVVLVEPERPPSKAASTSDYIHGRTGSPNVITGPSGASFIMEQPVAGPSSHRAPSIVSAVDRERVREALGVPSRAGSSHPASRPVSRAPSSRAPSSVGSGFGQSLPPPSPPTRTSTVDGRPPRSGNLSNVTKSPAKAPTPPLARQSPHLSTADRGWGSPAASRPATSPGTPAGTASPVSPTSPRSRTSRKINVEVRELDPETASVISGHSIAAMSTMSKAPKVTRIFEVAEVIPGERPLSVVTEESVISEGIVESVKSGPLDAPGRYNAIEEWAAGYRAKLDSIEERIREVKADVLLEKSKIRVY